MNTPPFALGWIVITPVFGHLREINAHDFYDNLDEMIGQIKKLKALGVTQITPYRRVDGVLVEYSDEELQRLSGHSDKDSDK